MICMMLFLLAQNTVFIEGTVVGDQGTGPLGQATVGIRYETAPDKSGIVTPANKNGSVMVTENDGRFRLEVAKGVPFHFLLDREGYASAGQTPATTNPNLKFTLTNDKAGITIIMEKSAELGGRLIDYDTEKPIVGLGVIAFDKREGGAWSIGPRTNTDTDGRFRFPGIKAGEYKLQTQSGLLPKLSLVPVKKGDPAMGYPPTYFPGVADFPSGSAIRVMKGSVLDYFDLKLKKVPFFKVGGLVRVENAPGPIQVSSSTRLGSSGASLRMIGSIPQPGPFTIENVPEGQFSLTLSSSSAGNSRRLAVLDLFVDRNNEELDVLLSEGLKLRVMVSSFGDKQIEGDPLWLKIKPKLSVSFLPLSRAGFLSEKSHTIDSVGGVEIDEVFTDPYYMSIQGLPNGWVVRRVDYNGYPVDHNSLRLDPSRPEHILKVLVSAVSNSISGEVRLEDKPCPNAQVYAIAEPIEAEPGTRRIRIGTSQSDGTYALQTLVPGVYHILAARNLGSVEGLAALRAGKGKKVEIGETGFAQLALTVID